MSRGKRSTGVSSKRSDGKRSGAPTPSSPAATCELVEVNPLAYASPELAEITAERQRTSDLRTYVHKADGKELIVTVHNSKYTLEEAHLQWMGVRNWRTAVIGVKGSLQKRLEDARQLGRPRAPGERSPVPLPDWYDLTHVAFSHPELGFSPLQPIYQVLVPKTWEYINFAEALHIRQPR